MGHLSSLFNGLARSFTIKRTKSLKNNCGDCDGREAVEAMARDAKRNELVLTTSGVVNVDGSKNLVSVYSKRGEKGVNQDCCTVWEEFGCQEDMVFCGVFDGHGSWGHFVAKHVRESLPASLLCYWQESLVDALVDDPEIHLESPKKLQSSNIWKHSYMKACAAVDRELEQHRRIDTYHSGTTALTVVRQGDNIYLANVGDSRAVLGTASDKGNLAAVQLTIDFKPNLPQEAERIIRSNGRVCCLDDEPGVQRLWLPHDESPGLAMSRAFGDYCVKAFGLISIPEVIQRRITSKDQFIILATDGVWDVVSNQEAVKIVEAAPSRPKSAKCVVDCAAQAWKKKRKGIAMDDISAIVLFLDSSTSLPPQLHISRSN
ncbi:probable protein phosphatase 2C 34 [Andrographis paniculata]|uniref:probable protein phosphatase 2C 34 n=1 Tax=Andrographis paniculata TaxID=175694 RepID=UPI0021E70AA4|nr:probable protein phosphatase 2C 34 [Andrographis paniculata]XP_051124373.1 probable protein phosphatase 2C 34 [Andrographis paniculata]